ncbi:MAG: hypothetical protein V1827_00285 [Candidatus Micrarchaeota archaeon]
MFTTSRYASRSTRSLARSMAEANGEKYIARGKKTIDDLASYARRMGEDRMTIIEEKGGVASRIVVIDIDPGGKWSWGEERLLKISEKEVSR